MSDSDLSEIPIKVVSKRGVRQEVLFNNDAKYGLIEFSDRINYILRRDLVAIRPRRWWTIHSGNERDLIIKARPGNVGLRGIICIDDFGDSKFFVPYEGVKYGLVRGNIIPRPSSLNLSQPNFFYPDMKNFVKRKGTDKHQYPDTQSDDRVDKKIYIQEDDLWLKLGWNYYESQGVAYNICFFLMDHLGWPDLTCSVLAAIARDRVPLSALTDGLLTREEFEFLVSNR